MMAARCSYYIYYQVADPDRARIVVEHLFERILAATGIRGRLLIKRDQPGLWMEVYEDIEFAAQFEDSLTGSVKGMNFDRVLAPQTARQLECFHAPCV